VDGVHKPGHRNATIHTLLSKVFRMLHFAVFVAHPGHELRLYGWIERTRPVVSVLTDGSGSGARSRIASTKQLLDRCGAAPGSIFGRVSDRELYRDIFAGNVKPYAAMVIELAQMLVAKRIDVLVADAWELYNPSHDLCRVMADLAVELARDEHAISTFAYAVTRPRNDPPARSITLDDAELARKIEAANAYAELRDEVEQELREHGSDALRVESLFADERRETSDKPFYEQYGEQQVRGGRYQTVLRHREHFLPFVEQLSAALRRHEVAP